MAVLLTPVQTVVTRWQYSLHQYRQMSLGGSTPYTSTDSCHSVAVLLTPVQTAVTRWQYSLHQYRHLIPVHTKQIRMNIHKRNNTKHSKYKHTYYQNTPTHTLTHTLQKNHSTRYTPVKKLQCNRVMKCPRKRKVTNARSTNDRIQSLSNSATPWSRCLIVKLIFPQLATENLSVLWKPEVHHRYHNSLPLSSNPELEGYRPRPHFISWLFVLILPSVLPLGIASSRFSSGFRAKTLYAPLFPIRATCPAHLILSI
jgi:hypothetical protein